MLFSVLPQHLSISISCFFLLSTHNVAYKHESDQTSGEITHVMTLTNKHRLIEVHRDLMGNTNPENFTINLIAQQRLCTTPFNEKL